MIRQFAVAASIALLGMSGQAWAGQAVELSNVKGSVLVNQNGRYVPVKSATVLRAGDRVLAMNGDADLTYADGCVVKVASRSMATIGDACGGSAEGQIIKAQYGSEGGDVASNADLWLFLGFGLLTAVVVAAAWNDDEEPVSP